jgi:galactokinase
VTATWWAPDHVNMAGKATDGNGGCVPLPAIPLGLTATVSALDDEVLQASSDAVPRLPVGTRPSELRPGSVPGWSAHVGSAAAATWEGGRRVGGIDVHIGETVPGSGLSSSVRLWRATVCALAYLFGSQSSAGAGVGPLREISGDGLPGGARWRRRHGVTEISQAVEVLGLLGASRIRELGDVLTAPQSFQREDFEVSLPEVDPAVDNALRDGSPGTELIGGGFGRRVVTLVEADGPPSSRADRVPCPRAARPVRARLHDRGRHRWRTPAADEHREAAEATPIVTTNWRS